MKATLTVLGSGTSMGVPTIGCDCAVCRSSDPRDRRTRPSVLIEYGGRSVLIDTTPDFREQAIREDIRSLDAVLYTHAHADHILGIDDLRPLSFRHRPGRLPLYAHPDVVAFVRNMFRYIFDADYKFGGLPQVELKPLEGPLELFGARFEPVTVIHGETEIYGFRFGSAAYLTDHSRCRSHVRQAAEPRHPFSGCAAAQAPSDAFDGREFAPHRGTGQTQACILHPYLPRSAACGNQCHASAACTAFVRRNETRI